MIIECPQCSTKFKLDDSKIGSQGVKVRCSKCKHIFTVYKEEEKPPEPEPEPAPEPPSSEKKEESSESFEFKDETPPPGSHPPSSEEKFDDGLGDLSFKEDTQPPPPSQEESDDFGMDDLSFDDEDFADEGEAPPPPGESEPAGDMDDDFGDFDLDEEPASLPGSEPEPKPSAPNPDETMVSGEPSDTGAGDVDDFDFDDFSDFSDESQSAAPLGADAGKEADLGGDFDGSDLDVDLGAAGGSDGGEDIQEFGDISFDDVGGKSPEPAGDMGGAAAGDEFQMDMGPDTGAPAGQETPAAREQKPARGGGDAYAFEAESSEVPETEIPAPSRKETEAQAPPREEVSPKKPKAAPKKKGKGGKLFVLILILGAIAGGGYYMRTQGMLEQLNLKEKINISRIKEFLGIAEEKPPQNIIKVAPVKPSDLYSVSRNDGKTLWVIKGAITNLYSTSQGMILLEGKLIDDGQVRKTEAMYGNVLERSQLKRLSIERIHDLLQRTEDDNLNPLILLPEKSAEYMIVFDNIKSSSPKLPESGAVTVKNHRAF